MKNTTACIVTVIVLAVSSGAFAAEPLVPERPGQSDSATLLKPGRYQLETGYAMSHNNDDGVETDVHQLGSSLLRIGLEAFELRFGWDGLIDQDVTTGGGSTTVDGPGDAKVGAKFHLWNEKGRRPQIALLAGVTLPIGDDDLSSDRPDPDVRLSMAHSLTDRVGLGYNFGMAWSSELDAGNDRDTLSRFIYTVATSFSVRDRLGAFVELFGEFGGSAGGCPSNSVDGGISYLIRENLQFDASMGLGISDHADDWFVSTGVSARWPN